MGYDLDKLYEGPRSERRAKRKRVNRILNILIALIVILIVFFGGKLIFGDKNVNDSVSSNQTNQPANGDDASVLAETEDQSNETKGASSEKDAEKNTDEPKQETKSEADEDQTTPEPEEADVVTEGDPESNIANTIVNPAWKPIGTEQSEPHTIVFDSETVDRSEMEMAISYATGFDKSDMVVWWLGRNGGNSITATVSSKTTKQVLKVYLDWVTNEGWKPVKIEELKGNDSPTYKDNNDKSESEEDENETDEDEDEE